jgi:transglutaminase-like putative cysteine protease
MKYSFGCELAYRVAAPTVFILNVEVAQIAAHGDLRDSLKLDPHLPRESFSVPPFGNRYTRFTAQPGPLRIRYAGTLDLQPARTDPGQVAEIPIGELPLDTFAYLQASRFCESDRLAGFARENFGALEPGFSRVTAICNWICENVEYRRGSSNEQTSAAETLAQRAGVCRDFSHLAIALCRALNIPARFVSCYALGLAPADFHAVFEAYLGGSWWLFDPTRQAALDGLIRIGIGRDAAKVAFASIYGDAEPVDMRVGIKAGDPQAEADERTIEAVRTA